MMSEEVKVVDILDAFEKMVFQSGRLSLMIDRANLDGDHKTRVKLEKLASLLDEMIATCKKQLTPDDLLEIIDRMDLDKAMDDIHDDIKSNIEIRSILLIFPGKYVIAGVNFRNHFCIIFWGKPIWGENLLPCRSLPFSQ